MHLEFVNNALTTMLLDAIGHFHKNKKQKECFGIVFGDKGENFIGDLTFPVGNVVKKTASSVEVDWEVNAAITDARKLVSTSELIAYYHSHPYDDFVKNWADPSETDFYTFQEVDADLEIIIAIAKRKDAEVTDKFCLEYEDQLKSRFWMERVDNEDEYNVDYMDEQGQYIKGYYKDYDFEVRAYRWTGETLDEVKLYSSEVEMNRTLAEAELFVEDLPKEALYYLKKLEYSLHLQNKDKYKEKIPYLIERIKSTCQTEQKNQ